MSTAEKSAVRDRIVKDYMAKKATSSSTPSEEPVPLFVDEPVSTANPDAIWYSDKFSEAKEFLAGTDKKDIDISSIYNERDDWAEEHKIHIPQLDSNYVWQHEVLYPALLAMKSNLKTLMVGGTGTGKTAFYQNLAATLNQPLYHLNGRGDMESDSIIGRVDIKEGSTTFKLGEFTKAWVNGYFILLDEIWKIPASIMMVLQRALERGGVLQIDDMDGELVDKTFFPHDKTYVALADNVVGTGDDMGHFSATNLQDSSTLNRVDVVLRMNYLKSGVEVDMLCSRYSFIPTKTARNMVALANQIRTAYEKSEVEVTMSPRNLMAWAELARCMDSYEDGFRATMLERYADEGEKAAVRGLYQTCMGKSL